MHRFVWDLYYPPVSANTTTCPIAAILHDTPPDVSSPLAMPAEYTVRLTVDGRAITQPLTLQMDPRVKTPREELAQQFAESMKVYTMLRRPEPPRKAIHPTFALSSSHSEELAAAVRGLEMALA